MPFFPIPAQSFISQKESYGNTGYSWLFPPDCTFFDDLCSASKMRESKPHDFCYQQTTTSCCNTIAMNTRQKRKLFFFHGWDEKNVLLYPLGEVHGISHENGESGGIALFDFLTCYHCNRKYDIGKMTIYEMNKHIIVIHYTHGVSVNSGGGKFF